MEGWEIHHPALFPGASDQLVIHFHFLQRLDVILSTLAGSGPQRVTKQQLNVIDPLIGRVS